MIGISTQHRNRRLCGPARFLCIIECTVNIYRAEQSCGKLIFSQACVKNSVHVGVSAVNACWDTPPSTDTPQGRPPWADTPRRHPPGRHLPRQTPPGRHLPWADTPRADTPNPAPPTATAADGTHPTGMFSRYALCL